MAWTEPRTWSAEVLTSTLLNTHLRDNLNALKDPPSSKYTFNDSADWTTSSTSWSDIDATDLSLTITTYGGDVVVHFHGTMSNTTQGQLDITVDSVRHFGDDGILRVANANHQNPSFTVLVEGLSAGSHTFRMQWKSSTAAAIILYAGAGTANNDLHGMFWAREVS